MHFCFRNCFRMLLVGTGRQLSLGHLGTSSIGSVFQLARPWWSRSASTAMTRYLGQAEAVRIDEELFNDYHFSVDQLMELAGLSCASAIVEAYPEFKEQKILVVVGPGNNGGDGLVCARHLRMFGYHPEIYYPKKVQKDLYINLTRQCELCGIPFLTSLPDVEKIDKTYSLVVDALFGFSFKPPVRPEFCTVIHHLANTKLPVCSIDIPSGWHVESGPSDDASQSSVKPEMLISLTAPKLCARYFKGKFHYLGGLFVPEKMAEEYCLNLPAYSYKNCVCLSEK